MRFRLSSAVAALAAGAAAFLAFPVRRPATRRARVRQVPRGGLPGHGVDQARRERRSPHAVRQRPRVPGLPRRRERAPQGAHEESDAAALQAGGARSREERRVPDLPRRQPSPHVLGVGSPLEERRLLQQLPQRARRAAAGGRVRRAPAPRSDRQPVRHHRAAARVRDLHPVPQADPLPAHKAFASPDHRGQGEVLRLPQPAWRAEPRDGEERIGESALHDVPRRQARAVHVGAPAGRAELPDLPQLRTAPRTTSCSTRRCRTSARTATTGRGTPGTFYDGSQGWQRPPAQGGPSTRFIARSCTNCHNAIHGSNAPANRGQFFTR